MDTDWKFITLYAIVGACGTLITWPYFRGRSVGDSFSGGSDMLHFLGLIVMWPLMLLAVLWIFMLWYRNYWIDCLVFRDEKRIIAMKKEFDDRWVIANDSEKSQYGYDRQHQHLTSQIADINNRIYRRRYFLEEQTRDGVWKNPFR